MTSPRTDPQSPQNKRTSQRPSLLACNACRSRHLKCDGRQPVCTRCLAYDTNCDWTPSRRGLRRSRKVRKESNTEARSSISDTNSMPPHTTDSYAFESSGMTDPGHSVTHRTTISEPRPASPHGDTGQSLEDRAVEDHLIDHYYTSFHASHPILPPRHAKSWQTYPARLKSVMQLIGSHYCSAASVAEWNQKTQRCFHDRDPQPTLFDVQAFLLHSISSKIIGESTVAQDSLHRAVKLALDLRLHESRTHLTTQGYLGQCAANTWWQLVEIDALCAAVSCRKVMVDGSLDPLLPLPNDDSTGDAYAVHPGSSRPSTTLADLAARVFDDGEPSAAPSSSSKIETVVLLRRILAAAGKPDVDPQQVRSLEYQLSSWLHHLPTNRNEVINTCGLTDFALFQANVIVNVGSIILHFPRSNLVQRNPISTTSALACAPNNSVPVFPYSVHSVKAINASGAICDLATLRLPLQKVSPFFVFALSLATMVQLSAARVHHEAKCSDSYKSRVVLLLGVLKSMGEFFDIAKRTEQQLRPLARHIFTSKHTTNQEHNCGEVSDALDLSTFLLDDPWAWNPFNVAGDLPNLNLDELTTQT